MYGAAALTVIAPLMICWAAIIPDGLGGPAHDSVMTSMTGQSWLVDMNPRVPDLRALDRARTRRCLFSQLYHQVSECIMATDASSPAEVCMPEQPITRCEFEASKLVLRLDMTVAATFEEVRALIDKIMETVTDMGCGANKEDDVRLAVDEALMNALVHGCKEDPAKTIQCCVACDDERGILIIVRDPGPGFDPASIPSPIVGKNLFAERGRGIFLINQMADEVKFERGGTEIRIRFK